MKKFFDANNLDPAHRKLVVRTFIILFLIVGAALAGTITILYHLETDDYLLRLKNQELMNLKVQRNLITISLDDVVTDLRFLTRQNELSQLLESDGQHKRAGMETEYLAFSRLKRKYDQIRFIDNTGMERVRVDFNNGTPAIIPDTQLQNKGDRYYVKDTIALGPDEIFVSPLDLNMEQGEVETPFKPMMRFGTPVFDENSRKQGIVVLNYLGSKLIRRMKFVSLDSPGEIMLVNANGFWLSSPRESDEWGFMIAERESRNFHTDFPEEWQQISSSWEVQIQTDRGLFRSTTIYPVMESFKPAPVTNNLSESDGAGKPESYPWKLISHIPAKKLNLASRGLLIKLTFSAILLFLVAAIPSLLIARAIVSRRLHQEALHRSANYDKLTNLPNRSLFLDRLSQVFMQSKRYERKFAILFIDLDGFKAVNDTMGHDAGDDLLIQVAARLLKKVRQSDTVARLGGDEFTVILSTITTSKDAEKVAGKIIETLATPFMLKTQEAKIGASIGVSVYPEHGEDADILLKKADEAMYLAKKQGKNDYRMSAP